MSRTEAENLLVLLRAFWPQLDSDIKQMEIATEAERACLAVIRRSEFQVIEGGRVAA